MKYERGALYTINSPLETFVLNDTTLTPDVVIFWIDGANASHGYDDTTHRLAAYGASSVDAANSINAVVGGNPIVGKLDSVSLGEFDVRFSQHTPTVINFVAIEF